MKNRQSNIKRKLNSKGDSIKKNQFRKRKRKAIKLTE